MDPLVNSKSTVPNSEDDMASNHVRMYEQLRSNRGNWEIQWNEIARQVFPNDLNAFQGFRMTEGEKRTQYLFDSTANTALSRFMSILDSLLTPHNSKWHTMATDDPQLNKNRQVKEYFDTVTDILFRERYKEQANFIEQNQSVYTSLGAYGTGGLFIDQLWGQPGIRYKYVHLGEIYFAENHQGTPDKFYRHYYFTARQAYQKWGDTCPDQVRQAATTNPESLFEFLHVVVPRLDYDPRRRDFKGMPWRSMDIAIIGKQMLGEGGYRTCPYAISRYSQSLNEVYGRSPVMDVLPTIKTLNEEKKTMLKQAHRIVDPVYLVYDDGILNTMDARPGQVLAGGVSADGRALVHTLPTGNIQIGKEVMDDDRSDIKDALLTSLFQILMETPEMTATEVMERVKEKGMLIAPTLGRQEKYLSTVINREVDVLRQQGRIPDMPRILVEANGQYKIRYESPLAKMRRSDEAAGIMRLFETSLQIAQGTQDPTVMHYFNLDVIMPELADIQGIPTRWMNTADQVKKLKQGMQQQQQAQLATQALPGVAALAKVQSGK